MITPNLKLSTISKNEDLLICNMDADKRLPDLHPAIFDSEEILLAEIITVPMQKLLKENLLKSRLDFLDSKDNTLIKKLETAMIELIYNLDGFPVVNLSAYLSEKLTYNYTYLSNKFSRVKGITIEHYIINLKIERIKSMLLDEVFNLTEISYKLHYSSLAHLCNQFKKTTGFSPSMYRHLKLMHVKNYYGKDIADDAKAIIVLYDWNKIKASKTNLGTESIKMQMSPMSTFSLN